MLGLTHPITIKDVNKRDIEREFKVLTKLTLINRDEYLITEDKYLDKNRYSDILCYKHNRVKTHNDFYINANWINNPLVEKEKNFAVIT